MNINKKIDKNKMKRVVKLKDKTKNKKAQSIKNAKI